MAKKGGLYVRTSGYLITDNASGQAALIQETVQCVHCQRHRVYDPKTVKAMWCWCMGCSGPVCNEPACALKCVPAEQWLENVEQGKPEDHKRIIVANPGL